MSTQLTDAIIGSITYGLNPNNAATAEFIRDSCSKLKLEVNDLKLNQMLRIQGLVAEAVDTGAKASVIQAYEDMLTKLVNL